MKNDIPFQELLDDLNVFMEVSFFYKGKRYSITYDENHAYLFDMKNPNELAVFHPDEAIRLVDVPVFDGKTLKEIWPDVEVELL